MTQVCTTHRVSFEWSYFGILSLDKDQDKKQCSAQISLFLYGNTLGDKPYTFGKLRNAFYKYYWKPGALLLPIKWPYFYGPRHLVELTLYPLRAINV